MRPSNDHRIFGITPICGAEWRKPTLAFPENADFQPDPPLQASTAQTEDRPAQPAPLLAQEICIPWGAAQRAPPLQ